MMRFYMFLLHLWRFVTCVANAPHLSWLELKDFYFAKSYLSTFVRYVVHMGISIYSRKWFESLFLSFLSSWRWEFVGCSSTLTNDTLADGISIHFCTASLRQNLRLREREKEKLSLDLSEETFLIAIHFILSWN